MTTLSRRQVMQGAGAVGLGLLAGCGQWPGQVPAPEPAAGGPKVPRIGHLGASTNPLLAEQLAALGYVEGQTLLMEWRADEGRAERLAQHVAETDALLVVHSGVIASQQAQIVRFAARERLPAMYGRSTYPTAGGLAAYGPSLRDLYARAATQVDKILKGAKPADLPMEQPMRFDFAINLKTAQTLGLTIPYHVLLQATEVIQ